ncbi:branched-chain amino acid ABC transporter permease [Prosthecomicrobium hirschii]|uniref:branched-chain amino acid ABC transporter permease n=1 Tax=Prosthecodimorpha hirschii TaxID=665126 RepID=UPI00221EEECA|nr:branched-chain amino acid ABC transporter permease [Prosthecomicrobium hirschii]MCW1838826.1 branched-chain amino acid ABC transporter permease [Prosthecomicrobium hirschii]
MTGSARFPILFAVIVLALLPLGATSNTLLNFMTFALIVALAAQGWNLLGGYGGQFSFGHAAFFGTGAYAMGLLQVRFGLNPWAAMPVAMLLGAAVGWAIGFLAFRARLRGAYFALVTLAFAEVFRILANAWAFTGAAAGLLVPLKLQAANMQFEDKRLFYWLVLAFVAGALVLTAELARSRFGARLVALRENEDAARALGVDTLRVKLAAITLSAGVTAAAGGLYAQKSLYLDAAIAYGPWISVDALLAPIVGGLGTVFGPLIGALALLGLGELSKMALGNLFGGAVPGIDLIVFGILLILAVAFAPRGLLGLFDRLIRRPRPAKGGEATP